MKIYLTFIPVILVLVFILIALFSSIIMVDPNDKPVSQNNNVVNGEETPLAKSVVLELENGDKDIESTNINIAVPEDITEYKLILPDGTEASEDLKEYRVAKNGTYKFKFILPDSTEFEKTIDVNNISSDNKEEKKPTYIPDGFEYKEGTIDTGYVITDQYGNEFVWVPVDSGVISRNNKAKMNYEEIEPSANALVNSVASYYGFYIARYECSQADFDGEIVAVSIADYEPWSGVGFSEALSTSESFAQLFGYSDVSTALMNSFAWDTTLNWLNKSKQSYSSSLDYGNYGKKIKNTGENTKDKVNNIFDMAGNLKEWTTETSKNKDVKEDTDEKEKDLIEKESNSSGVLRVVRGGCIGIKKSAESRVSFDENLTDNNWGFRIIMYK